MANVGTLKPYRKGEERARINAAKGGKAKARNRAEAKAHGMTVAEWGKINTFAKAAREIAGMRAQGAAGRRGKTYAEAAMEKLWKQAQRGSVRAFQLIAMLLGEIPTHHAVRIVGHLPTLIDEVPRI